jgi:hypothetical protein
MAELNNKPLDTCSVPITEVSVLSSLTYGETEGLQRL